MPNPILVFSVVLILVTENHCQRLANRMMNSLGTSIRHLPYVVAFYEDHIGVCGTGTILSEKWVLTAAHIWDVEPYPYITNTKDNTVIKYGSTYISRDQGEIAVINDIFIHPQYSDADFSSSQYDVSLIQVEGDLPLKPGKAEVKRLVDEGKEYSPGYVCVLAGYGDSGNKAEDAKPHQLKFLPMPILKRPVCLKHTTIPDNMVCAGLLKVSSGPCDGDSGAPLACGGRVYGTLSRGAECAKGVVNVNGFVLINHVRDFIRQITGV